MNGILAILLVTAVALAAGNLFGGGAHAHPNPEGANVDADADHFGHVLHEYIRENDPRFLAILHKSGTYHWDLLWENGTAVGGDERMGSFAWPPDSGNNVTFSTGFSDDNEAEPPPYLNTNFTLRFTDGTNTLVDVPYTTTFYDDVSGFLLPIIEFDADRTSVNITITHFLYDVEHLVDVTFQGSHRANQTTVNSTGLLGEPVTVSLSGLGPNTGYQTRVQGIPEIGHPASYGFFDTPPPLLNTVNDEADLVNATSGHVDIPILTNDIFDPADIYDIHTLSDIDNRRVRDGTDGRINIVRDGDIGGATVIDNTIRYTATNPALPATDTFAYSVTAFGVTSEPANVTVNIRGVAPTLHDIENRTIPEGSALTITLNATDPNNATSDLIFGISDEPEGMTVTGNMISWEPAEAQGPGDYTFNVTVTDNTYSDWQLVTVTVTEVNQAPVFDTNQTQYSAPIGEEFQLDLNATDEDIPEQTVSYQITEQNPAGNPAVINATTGMISWTPDTHGTRIITVQASDDYTPNGTSSITLNIAVLTPPTTTAATITVNQSGTESINLAAAGHISDAQQSAATLVVTVNDIPAQTQGMASASGTTVTYTANATASGTDEISYTVTDDDGLSATGVINVRISTPTNAPPTAQNFTHDIPAVPEQPLQIPIMSRISDDQPFEMLDVFVPSQPDKGAAVYDNGTITYTANRDSSGNDTIVYRVRDEGGLAADGMITVTIDPITVPKPAPQNNTAPTAENFTHDTAAVPGQPLEIPIASRISDEQQPAEMLNVTIPVRPGQGNATYHNGTITYIADSGAVGNDTISYLVVDDGGLNATGIITVTISAQAPAPNTPPTAGGVIAMADTGETITINLAPHVNDNEDAAADLTVSITVQPTLGTASMTPGTQEIQYTAGQNTGTDTITYAVADSGGLNATGTITITISASSTPAPNTPPTAQSFTHDIPAVPGTPLDIPITARVSDDAPLGDPPNVSISSPPNQGTATYAGGTITYTANAGATGTDTITYVVTDAGSLTATGTITVTIQPPRGTPGPVTPEPVQPEPGLGSTVPIRQCTR